MKKSMSHHKWSQNFFWKVTTHSIKINCKCSLGHKNKPNNYIQPPNQSEFAYSVMAWFVYLKTIDPKKKSVLCVGLPCLKTVCIVWGNFEWKGGFLGMQYQSSNWQLQGLWYWMEHGPLAESASVEHLRSGQ